jgi:hypothetical protein
MRIRQLTSSPHVLELADSTDRAFPGRHALLFLFSDLMLISYKGANEQLSSTFFVIKVSRVIYTLNCKFSTWHHQTDSVSKQAKGCKQDMTPFMEQRHRGIGPKSYSTTSSLSVLS